MRENEEEVAKKYERRTEIKKQWDIDKERRRLMEDTQTFDSRTMGRAAGFRQIKSGGRTPVEKID